MDKPPNDPSVHDEPHLRDRAYHPDPSEGRTDRTLDKGRRKADSEIEAIDHGVWDEPGLSPSLAGPTPPEQLTYARWLERHRHDVSWAKSWWVTAGVALAAGPWAVLGAFWGGAQTFFSILAITVFGPVVEEVMKTALLFYVMERKPYLFRSAGQITICALAGGFAFACIENLLYLHVYIAEPSPGLVHWRWTICVALHMGCSSIVGLGLMRIWREVWGRRVCARLTVAYPYLLTAVVLHGAYNALAILISMLDYRL